MPTVRSAGADSFYAWRTKPYGDSNTETEFLAVAAAASEFSSSQAQDLFITKQMYRTQERPGPAVFGSGGVICSVPTVLRRVRLK